MYVLPHVDGRMNYPERYSENIPVEALKLLGFNGEWVWESYDSTEVRHPHIIIDTSNSQLTRNTDNNPPINKLRHDIKPADSIDFPSPNEITKHQLVCKLQQIEYSTIANYNFVAGIVTAQLILDYPIHAPAILRLQIKFRDEHIGSDVGTVDYELLLSPIIFESQFKIFEDKSVSLNQILIIKVLELSFELIFNDISIEYPDFPYTKEMLSINNVRELLSDINLVFLNNSHILYMGLGSNLWESGYEIKK